MIETLCTLVLNYFSLCDRFYKSDIYFQMFEAIFLNLSGFYMHNFLTLLIEIFGKI